MSSCGDCTSVSQSPSAQQVQIAIEKKRLDHLQSQGDAVLALLEAAVNLSKAPGKGAQFDAVA
jgi:hypothetical protein